MVDFDYRQRGNTEEYRREWERIFEEELRNKKTKVSVREKTSNEKEVERDGSN
jgi:uncharacterized membrane protein YgaE (UPF0421/DUF939 family)